MTDPSVDMHRDSIKRGTSAKSSRVGGDHDPPQDICGHQLWRFTAIVRIANFSELRRRLGRSRADRLASDVAARVQDLLPDARLAIAARDLIEVVFEEEAKDNGVATLSAIKRAFDATIEFEHEWYKIEVLLGSSAAEAIACDEVRMLEEAEIALSHTSAVGPVVFHDLAARRSTHRRSALADDILNAMAAEELFLQYQPKIHLRRQEVVGVEALIRWDHRTRGLILPSDFIPAAEESQSIGELTLWTLRRAIRDQQELAARGHDIPVYLNVSGVLLSDARFVASVSEIISDDNARKIGFEITETAVIRDPDSAIANLQTFADIGVAIAIDDYGAGLSSLSYLKRLPATELKIDKLFVTQLTSSHRDPLIVRSTIDLAHALEMQVTAEGVETPAVMALLSVMGCDMAQGFFISRPIGLDALLHFLDEGVDAATTDTRAAFGGLAAAWKRA